MTVKARAILESRKDDPRLRPQWRTALALLVMAAAVVAVYFPFQTHPGDNTMQGGDYLELHLHRIQFAEEALFGPHPHLPGWYPRELLGTPFWSNIQNFPLIPTRLVLLLFDPLKAFEVGAILSAELAALFAFIFCRALGRSRIGAAAAGWTFACTGYYAARVICGHLPLLEAYPALPLLLWLMHRCLERPSGRQGSDALRVLGVTTTLVCFAGHPQLPAYAITAAAGYALWMGVRSTGTRWREIARILVTMGLAVGVAAIVLWPLLKLVARSTRILPLDAPDNDIPFPYERLLAFILPWRDGWPPALIRPPSPPSWFRHNYAWFWETVVYVGLLPLVAAGYWLLRCLRLRVWPKRPWAFVTAAGIAGLLLALPPMHDAMAHLPGIFLRSPARLTYFTLFALACGFGAMIDAVLNSRAARGWAIAAVAALLLFQGIDLGRHDRCFIRTCLYADMGTAGEQIKQLVGDGRAAVDLTLCLSINRQVDDAGYFDSIALAKPYQALIDLGDKLPKWNSQYLDGSDLNARALEVCAVRAMITLRSMPGDPPVAPEQRHMRLVEIPEFTKGVRTGAGRAEFFPLADTVIADIPTIHEHLRDQHYDLLHRLLIPTGSPAPPFPAIGIPPGSLLTDIHYTRDSEDRMTISATTQHAGYLRIDEAWDPGWHATIDGKPVPLFAGDDVFLTLPLSAGYHTVQLEFSTPGFLTGCILSIVCFGMMMWITRYAARKA